MAQRAAAAASAPGAPSVSVSPTLTRPGEFRSDELPIAAQGAALGLCDKRVRCGTVDDDRVPGTNAMPRVLYIANVVW
jgi:hypothetical protein